MNTHQDIIVIVVYVDTRILRVGCVQKFRFAGISPPDYKDRSEYILLEGYRDPSLWVAISNFKVN
jgi:hypothetical protein